MEKLLKQNQKKRMTKNMGKLMRILEKKIKNKNKNKKVIYRITVNLQMHENLLIYFNI
jgi:hypothetical protein